MDGDRGAVRAKAGSDGCGITLPSAFHTIDQTNLWLAWRPSSLRFHIRSRTLSVIFVRVIWDLRRDKNTTRNLRGNVCRAMLLISTVHADYRMTSCLKNLEIWKCQRIRQLSGKCQGFLLKVREMSGGNLVKEKLPKTIYCKLHIYVDTGIYHLVPVRAWYE